MLKPSIFVSTLALSIGVLVLNSAPAKAQQLDVPVMEYASDDLDTCAYGKVAGLKADGDGFLAVRSGPGSNYKKLDEVHNGEELWLFEEKGDWVGVMYQAPEISCSPTDVDRPVPHKGKKGWVHKNWVEFLAG
ncbi:SH3 domain-containing protein [uncultured Hoeflea sp.]|uniref:SH3 domain-containing protein n=1 Tax=uncultured Hoeflea sp. TaxID=538666 RepID=UPI0026348998|nr:SH3 domain-containing protein [uncultured Hoeflea sp.]